jgi:hypothetical protein
MYYRQRIIKFIIFNCCMRKTKAVFRQKKADKMVKGAINMWMLRLRKVIRTTKSMSIDNKHKNKIRFLLLYRYAVTEGSMWEQSEQIVKKVAID